MNRKQRIIVSITGIFLVLLILVGLTYAYFLTKIKGNDKEKSISVTTANLELVYGDGTQTILKNDIALEPDSDNAIGTKDFTVTNKGNDTSYVVVIEDVNTTNASDGSTTTFNSNDFRYTLTCTKKDGTSCDGVTTQTVFPLSGGILVGNSIKEGDVHTYVLTMWYIETGMDQSKDMGKTLQAKVNITNIQEMENPYSSNKNSLAYNIIENAKNKANGTELLSSPKTNPGESISSFEYYLDRYTYSVDEFNIEVTPKLQENYWTYGTGFIIDKTTGNFSLTGVSTCKYNDGECNNTLIGKYLVSANAEENSSSTNVEKTTTNLPNIYKITSAPSSSTNNITIKYKTYYPVQSSTEKELSITSDDYGTSYYYRGGVEDNYVNFAGMCWRIVRIEGDGSTKLILEDRNAECNSSSYTGNWSDRNKVVFGYNSNNKSDLLNNTKGKIDKKDGLADSLKNFQNSKLSSVLEKIKPDDWCYDDVVAGTESYGYNANGEQVYKKDEAINGWYTNNNYGPYDRLYVKNTPSLRCSGKKIKKFSDGTNMYVGTLTADEIVFAGGGSDYNQAFYLMNIYNINNKLYWWTLSPLYYDGESGLDGMFIFEGLGNLYNGYVNINEDQNTGIGYYSRPSITLKNNNEISKGNGTQNNPYIISS